jgi:hypothetical protein
MFDGIAKEWLKSANVYSQHIELGGTE